ncbi:MULTISPECIES: MFS transporter [Streptacidiphilus]|uniref:MFS transporter n=1 Tax=Streptacidiphilus cavernicola TaxID=3342716 RepID=A0ABV6UR88_9ACTN|nr:MFS transporter [Streptacidiphilus jeojiense]
MTRHLTHHRAIALVFAVHGAVAGTLTTCIPWLSSHYHLSPGLLGMVLFCPPVGAFVAMPMASRLAHRLGGRRTVRLLIALWCVLLPLPVLAPSPPFLFGAFLLFGAGAGISDVVMNAHAVSVEHRLGRSIISGLHGLWCVGSLLAGGLGILAAHYRIGARPHLLATAALLLAVALVAGRGLAPDGTSAAGAPAPRRFSLPTRAILGIGVVGFFGTFTEGASTNWAGVYVTKVAGAGPGGAALAFTLFASCMAATRLLGDRFVRRFGAVAVVRAGGGLAAAGGAVMVSARTPWLCMVGLAMIGIGIAVVVPLVFAAAGRTGASAGEGVAGVATITYLSGLIAPAATGWTAGAFSYPAAFGLVTVMAALMALLAGALRPRSGAEAGTGAGGTVAARSANSEAPPVAACP